MKRLKMYRLLLPLLVGVLAVMGVLAVLNPDRAAADVHREWDGNWYWKDGGWTDYAPSGVPDFDQKQGAWQNAGVWSYCGPVAAANSLWWFDSKFEPFPQAPPTVNDNYWLVTAYGAWDDHDPANVGGGLVDHLACYFDTDGKLSGAPIKGTEVHTMAYGLQQYLYNNPSHPCYLPYRSRGGSYYDNYHVQLVKMPTWEWVEEEVERSEDVILLLGFWEDVDPTPEEYWVRLGGHYVTVAGINSTDRQIAFSDPFFDNAELGGPGRVLSGTLILHTPIPGHLPHVHNDAGNVSHDIYTVTLDVHSPGGLWEIEGYKYDPNFERQNCPQEFRGYQGDYVEGPPIFIEVEYAITMSPFHWKPGGEWVWLWYEGEWMWEWWWYKDDGDSCLPDFWWGLDPAWEAYDGPVVVANSFWWFDSKAETLVTGGWPTEPPTVTDHYNLIEPYGDWDDHAISNTVPFIEDLATNYLNTGTSGTSREDMAAGIDAYLAAQGVAADFYTTTQDSPYFGWVADEVETCEDVILLLGFWEYVDGDWQRKGGHWTNVAGVSRPNNLIGLSDPSLDNAMTNSVSRTLHLGRVFPPERQRQGTAFTAEEQKAPQNISHDIYSVTTSGDQLALPGYPVTSVLTDFIGLNGGGTDVEDWAHSFKTVVEWAIGVSPYSDLVVDVRPPMTDVVAGDNVTFTLAYSNTGLAAVHNVTITHMLSPNNLTSTVYSSYPPLSGTPGSPYTWTIPRLSYGQNGVITITGVASATGTVGNTATITGNNSIGGPTPDGNPDDNTSGISPYPYSLYLPLVMRNY